MIDDSKRKGLGRGLSALLGDTAGRAPTAAAAAKLKPTAMLPVEYLQPGRLQPRRDFDEEALEELAASIREVGIVQPIVVRALPGPNQFEIVAGERRWRAAQKAQLHEVPVVLRELDDRQTLEIAIVENVQRADLNAMEEAEAYQHLIADFGYTQETAAEIVGKSRSHVANTLRLRQLPPRVQAWVREGKLSAGNARAAMRHPDPEAFAKEIIEKGMSVREAEAASAKPAAPSAGHSAPKTKTADTLALEHDLTAALGLKVAIRDKAGKGTVEIAYKNLDQLQDFIERMKRPVPVINDN